MMEWAGLAVGLVLGFLLGVMSARAGGLRDAWKEALDKVGDRLDEGQTVQVSFCVTKIKGSVQATPDVLIQDQNWKDN